MRPVALVARGMARSDEPWSKDDALDALFFLRMVLVLVLGISFGLGGLVGFWPFLGAMLLAYTFGSYWLQYQNIDPEDFESKQPMEQEGMAQSVPLFILAWVTSYSLANS